MSFKDDVGFIHFSWWCSFTQLDHQAEGDRSAGFDFCCLRLPSRKMQLGDHSLLQFRTIHIIRCVARWLDDYQFRRMRTTIGDVECVGKCAIAGPHGYASIANLHPCLTRLPMTSSMATDKQKQPKLDVDKYLVTAISETPADIHHYFESFQNLYSRK
jgi:hypothetical protein